MSQSNKHITLHGNPVEVTGTELVVGSLVPNVTLTNGDLKDVNLADYAGRVIVLSVIPSIDTPTCQLQTRKFNEEASKISKEVVILTVSRDLPFAQKRWCGAEGVDQVVVLSDYKLRSFGPAFGVEIPNIGLLARAVFVVGQDSNVTSVQYVDEISAEPNYDEVLKAVADALS